MFGVIVLVVLFVAMSYIN